MLVTADRTGIAEGATRGGVTVTWDGGAVPIVVTLTEERPPVVGAPQPGGTDCGFPVRVAASDDTGLESVTLTWLRPDGTAFTEPMTPAGAEWAGRAGPFPVGGEVTLQVTATDVRGQRRERTRHAATGQPLPPVMRLR